MKANRVLVASARIASVVAVSLTIGVTPALASSSNANSAHFNRGSSVFDDFNQLYLRPDSRSYWYVENMGALPDGSEVRSRDTNCDLQTCVRALHEGEDKFARLEIVGTDTHSAYTNANISEDVDGAQGDPVYGGQTYPGAWNPTVGHPVTIEARVRFSSNYKADGSGGAGGTAGIWLWSNPFSQEVPAPYSYGIYDGMGFSWTSQDSVIRGLATSVLKSTQPIHFVPQANPNMSDWSVYKFVWSTDAEGNQSVVYYLNGTQVDTAFVPASYAMHNMGLEMWNDNQTYSFTGLGRMPIAHDQYFDVDYVSMQQQ